MIEPFFKQPRERDEKHLAWIRTLPCCVCGSSPVDPAHLRVASINADKRETGMGEKPSDKWVLPLCRRCHERQHRMNESEFWAREGIDPFAMCMQYVRKR